MYKSLLRSSTLLIACSLALFSFNLLPTKANFNGSWNLNEGKSELGNFARFATKKIKVEQKDDAITISKTNPSFNGGEDVTTTETLTFDGKTVEGTGMMNSKRSASVKWTDDGNGIVITFSNSFERNGQTFEVTGTESWTLAADGKSISITTVSQSPQGERTAKTVYDKE